MAGTSKEFLITKTITKKIENEIFEYLKNLNLSSQYDLHITITKDRIEFVGINRKEKYHKQLEMYCGEPKRISGKTSWMFTFYKNKANEILEFIKQEYERITKELK